MAATAAGLNHLISFPKKVQVHFGQNTFKNIPDSYPRILITMDRNLNSDFNGIRNINALDFLTGKEKLVF